MRYTEEMILRSSSGYCMPFEEPIKQDVQMSLGYGEQKNPVTGETFFHHGIDFSVNHYLLSAGWQREPSLPLGRTRSMASTRPSATANTK